MATRRLGLLITIAATLCGSAAMACVCAPYASAAAQLNDASVMFVGRATRTDIKTGGRTALTRFAVTRTLKGRPQAVRWVRHSLKDSCAVRFRRGDSYTVLAFGADGQLGTGACGKPLFPLTDYEKVVGEAR